ncbi:MAG: WD40 repeat protein [Myxococcota bacterium]|jgi:WD40 repeat protein
MVSLASMICLSCSMTRSPWASRKIETTGSAQSVAVSPDGQRLVVGDPRGQLYVYDASGVAVVDGLRAHLSAVRMAFADNDLLVTIGRGERVRLWDLQPDPPRLLQQWPLPAAAEALVASDGWIATVDAERGVWS